jgi:predicted Rossmann fold flavoprotein
MNYSTYSLYLAVAAWILSEIPTGAVHSGHFPSAMNCSGYSEWKPMTADVRQFDVIVLGAGAAGLMCAAVAGQRGRRVAVLEHNRQPGRKILISGGGRCNFTNLHCGPENFISNNPHFAKSALALYQPRHFLELVERYGIAWHEKTLGQLFCDGSARAIVEMLLAECALGGVEIVLNATCGGGTCGAANCACGATANGIYATSGGFLVECSQGRFWASSLVVATGGLSISKLGATGLGYELARQFRLGIVEPRPALVPLVLGGDEAGWTELAGVSAEVVAWAEPDTEKRPSGAKAQAHSEGSMYGLKPVPFNEKMLVTHRGLSGPAVLQASLYWRPGAALVFDFVPGIERSHPSLKNKNAARVGHPAPGVRGIPPFRTERERMGHGAVEAGFLSALREPGARRDLDALRKALREALPRRLADYLAEIGAPKGWTNAALEECERRLHRWEFHPTGTEGFEKAEVTAGGVDTADLQTRTMEARAVPGLFFIGEVVDVTGQLGGFNFQWAWASGVAAGRVV